jgi:hypothetical protein
MGHYDKNAFRRKICPRKVNYSSELEIPQRVEEYIISLLLSASILKLKISAMLQNYVILTIFKIIQEIHTVFQISANISAEVSWQKKCFLGGIKAACVKWMFRNQDHNLIFAITDFHSHLPRILNLLISHT